ncbi:glycosyltransferase involved in cell wall biosynthesis [Croceifilum oryzae]|uniref:Glycosyltransferase involved in cell wall biosynthesis n=1 Tax=Croceifilum oryzae TaxID=1553429 RepID=A0AAJ1TLI8_9BACL|nr:glycosyltransferase [Croceifilum oryzae]MDQ0418354.1 glycosyltransferase involved in cell wall biosynthesis [Croceifilum oryzae]
MSGAKKRRLAVIDTYFPWKLSGFRYWESYEILKHRPDTLFFASQLNVDEFPAKVFPFSQFQQVAEEEGITDVYCVFLNLTLSLLGHPIAPGSNASLNIRSFLDQNNIKLHSTLYPGGGLNPSTPNEHILLAAEGCETVFSNIREVLDIVAKSKLVTAAINTDYYSYLPKAETLPIELVFCAYNAPRKGFDMLVEAFNQLDLNFHLHLIGDWDNQLYKLQNPNYTFYGPLNPTDLLPIYRKSHVVINCSIPDGEALDGFPTTAASDAMATGCLLITTNPRNDTYFIQPNADYLRVSSSQEIVNFLNWIKADLSSALQIGISGAKKIHESYSCRANVSKKLAYIFGSGESEQNEKYLERPLNQGI